MKDPEGGNLDRIQIVKGWLDAEGALQEKVYDVAWSGDRKPGADGKLPPVGNTVDVANATWTNTIGAPDWCRCGRTRTSILPCARSITSACWRSRRRAGPLRRQAFQREDGQGSSDDDAGARLHVADLVHAV